MLGSDYFSEAPWKEDIDHLFECRCCGDVLNKFETVDPAVIDGETFCDKCSSDLSYLRWNGVIDGVAPKTKLLVKAVDESNYQKAWEQVYDATSRTVKHI
jgi:hypothetical protein